VGLTVAGRRPRGPDRSVAPGAEVRFEIEAGTLASDRQLATLAAARNANGGELRVLTPAPPWRRGLFASAGETGEGGLHFSVVDERAGVAEWVVALSDRKTGKRAEDSPETFEAPNLAGQTLDQQTLDEILATLARSGFPVLGDARRGGVAVLGGLRAALVPADEWWPEEAAFPPVSGSLSERAPQVAPIWNVSPGCARALRRAHPWVLMDDATEDPGAFLPGSLVQVRQAGSPLGLAHIEGSGRVAARMWHSGAAPARDVMRDVMSVEARIARALAARRRLMECGSGRRESESGPHTNALRLVHGEADGLPGLAVDRLGDVLRVLISGRACAGWYDRALDALGRGMADEMGAEPTRIEVLHLREPPAGRFECVRQGPAPYGPAAPGISARSPVPPEFERFIVHERGLRFWVDPGLSDCEHPRPGTGLYLDQRANRERVCERVRGGDGEGAGEGRGAGGGRGGGRWLNLFAHTGAFSVALLAAGAEEVVSVDLSAPYLRWLDDNLALNADRGVEAARHRGVRSDGRRYLAKLPPGERFRGIVLDPPTAAAAGRRFWSAKQGLEELVGDALERLEVGGWLLLCRNERSARRPLKDVLRRAAEARGVAIGKIQPAPPGDDFPRLRGFPEGDSFSGLLAQRAQR